MEYNSTKNQFGSNLRSLAIGHYYYYIVEHDNRYRCISQRNTPE